MEPHKIVIIEGTVKRESSVAGGFANARHFSIEVVGGQHRLASYKAAGDEAPTKCWTLSGSTTVSGIAKKKFKLRNDSLLVSLATQSYQTEELVRPGLA